MTYVSGPMSIEFGLSDGFVPTPFLVGKGVLFHLKICYFFISWTRGFHFPLKNMFASLASRS
jgi:hypothetical protein